MLGRDLTDEEASVRGTVVKGLTKSDIRFLDTFEGDVSVDLFTSPSSAREIVQRERLSISPGRKFNDAHRNTRARLCS